MSVFVVRAFVMMRQAILQHTELARQLALMEQRLKEHDSKIHQLVDALRQLMAPVNVPRKKRIGFRQEEP